MNTASGITIFMSETSIIPQWKPSNTYIHIGGDDPFCYTEVRYDTWWLASASRMDHCLEEMKKVSCVMITYEDAQDDTGFLQVKRVIKCLGMKHTTYDIKRQSAGWRRVWYGNYTEEGSNYMPHYYGTPVATIFDKGKRITFNAFGIEHGLVYYSDINVFGGLIDIRGNRKDVPFQYFVVTLENNPTFRKESIGTTQELRYKRGSKCDELLTIENCRGIGCPPQMAMGVPIVVGYWGKGAIPCQKSVTPLSELRYGHEKIVIDDQTQSWWVGLFKGIITGIMELFVDVVSTIMGTDWQSKVLIKIVIYYATFYVTKNNWLAALMTMVVFIANFV